MKNHSHLTRPLIAGLFALLFASCMFSEDGKEKNEEKNSGLNLKDSSFIFALLSDYKTGSYAAMGLGGNLIQDSINPIHSDAVVSYAGGQDIFVLNRLGRDNLQVLDRNSLKTVLQITFPSKSNPQAVLAKDNLLYVLFYKSDSIGIYNQADGTKKGGIDISAYADTVDHFPEAAAGIIAGNNLYVILQNLDINTYTPLQSRLLKISLTSHEIKSLDLPLSNPSNVAYDSSSDLLYIPCVGLYSDTSFNPVYDGGLLRINPSSLTVKDTVISEKTLQGNLSGVKLYNGKAYSIISKSLGDALVSINPSDKSASEIAKTGSYKAADFVIDALSKTIYFADKVVGMRQFNAETGVEKEVSHLKFKLPVVDMVLLPKL